MRRAPDLCALLCEAAASREGVVLVGEDDREEHRSYAEIYAGARRRAAALQAAGLERGERVVLVLNTSFEFLETFFGLMLLGAVPVPAYPPVAMSRLEAYHDLLVHLVETTEARLLVTDRAIRSLLGSLLPRCPTLERIVDVATLEGDADALRPVAFAPEGVAFIQCTSGSASNPKAVLLTHAALLANLRGIADAFRISDEDVVVCWLPLYHDLGLIGGMLSAIAQQIRLVLLPPSLFICDPASWWRAISRHRGTITGAPNFAFGLSVRRITDDELAALDLGSLRIAVCAAEPIQPPLIAAFCARMKPARLDPRAIYASYGLAESCVGVAMARPLEGLHVERVSRAALARTDGPRAVPCASEEEGVLCVAVGRAVTDTRVRVVGPDGADLPERCVGEVWVEGPSLMKGYLNQPEATRRAFVGRALRTGDLGYLVGDELFIVGRIKDMLIVRGRNYYAEDIEAAVETVEGVRRGNAVAFGVYDEQRGRDLLHVVAETRVRDPQACEALAQAVRRAVAERVGLEPHEVTLLPPGSLPKTTSGKKQRARCRELLQSGAILRRRKSSLLLALLRSQASFLWAALRRRPRPPAPSRLACDGPTEP